LLSPLEGGHGVKTAFLKKIREKATERREISQRLLKNLAKNASMINGRRERAWLMEGSLAGGGDSAFINEELKGLEQNTKLS